MKTVSDLDLTFWIQINKPSGGLSATQAPFRCRPVFRPDVDLILVWPDGARERVAACVNQWNVKQPIWQKFSPVKKLVDQFRVKNIFMHWVSAWHLLGQLRWKHSVTLCSQKCFISKMRRQIYSLQENIWATWLDDVQLKREANAGWITKFKM